MNLILPKKNIALLIVLIIIHALGLWASLYLFQKPFSYDSAEYVQLATNIKNGIYYSGNASLPLDPFYISLRPPVYSLFILGCWGLFGYKVGAILFVQNLISIFNCLLVKSTFDQLYPDTGKSFLFLILIIGFPMQVVFANMIFSDVLLQCFLMLYFRELLFSLRETKSAGILKMSLWLILAVFTKPIIFPFLFIHALFVIIIAVRKRKWLFIGYAALPVLLLFMYGQWNKQKTGLYHISSVQSVNLLDFNLAEYYTYKYGPEEMKLRVDRIKDELKGAHSFKEKYELSARIAKEKIKEEWLGYAFFHCLKGCQMFIDPNKLEFDIFAREYHYINDYKTSFMDSWRAERWKGVFNYLKHYPYLMLLLLMPVFGFIRLIGFIMFFFDRKNKWTIKCAVVLFVLYFVVITGPVANARYFLPIVLIVSACSWIGYANFLSKYKTKLNQRNVAS